MIVGTAFGGSPIDPPDILISMVEQSRFNSDVFIWTEAVGVPEILPPTIASYLRHNNQTLNVFIYDDDEFENPNPDQVRVIKISDSKNSLHPSKEALKVAYKYGHEGTALLWSFLLSSNVASRYVHLDADNIYVSNILDEIELALKNFSVVGFRRPYAKAANMKSLSLYQRFMFLSRPDTVGTSAIGLRAPRDKFVEQEFLFRKILGRHRLPGLSLLWPQLDFFDSVTNHLARRGGAWFLGEGSSPRYWGNPADPLSEQKFVSIGGVGTGCALWKAGRIKDLSPYEEFALGSFAMYSAKFLDHNLALKYREPPEILSRVDPETWTLMPR